MEAFDLSPLWISLKTGSVATALACITGITAARIMHQYTGRWQGLLDGLFTLPLVLPPTVIGFLLLWILGHQSPVGKLLQALGINIIFSWPATVIASTVVAFPLMYKTVLGAFRQVDSKLLHCARTLGATEAQVFWQVLFPLAWPGIVAGTILAFARSLGEFGATLMVAGSIPGRTQTMPIAIFLAGEAGHQGQAFFWVAVLSSLALGAIALIHYFDNPTVSWHHHWTEAIATQLQRWAVILTRKTRTSSPSGAYPEQSSNLIPAPPT